jgi:hypothetical protein
MNFCQNPDGSTLLADIGNLNRHGVEIPSKSFLRPTNLPEQAAQELQKDSGTIDCINVPWVFV